MTTKQEDVFMRVCKNPTNKGGLKVKSTLHFQFVGVGRGRDFFQRWFNLTG